MHVIRNIFLFITSVLLFVITSCNTQNKSSQQLQKAQKKIVKVIAVIQDPIINGSRLHEVAKTPGYSFSWHDPFLLNKQYEEILEEISGGVLDYEIVDVVDSDRYFTYLKKSGKTMTEADVIKYMQEPDWKTLKEEETGFDYCSFVEHFGFDKMCDAGEVDEIWVWTFPYGGMWESHMLGEGAFWLNSKPTVHSTCNNKLVVMGLNYERDIACAIESYGHRFESVMMEVFGWWKYDEKSELAQFTDWEIYCAYEKYYGKYEDNNAQIGNIHFPPNGRKDYDWACPDSVYTYADSWSDYPEVKFENPRMVNCSEWGCNHLGYMKWWFSHLPNFKGINPKNGKLNNWWHYVADYDEAIELELSDN